MTEAKTVTILFTDLVRSTELLQRAGDEQAQRIFKAHHRLLREALEAHGGHEVQWLGDGLMVAFDSAQEAVRCAIAMQQSARRPTAGERLEIRAGLNVGEVLVDESDYFGTPVVVARRLCDRAGSGQIFASDIVVRLLEGRGADVEVKELGPLELKGITNPVPAVEIRYQHDPMALLRKLPFVGRQMEFETLTKKLDEVRNGRGSVVLLAGEPGIGKTRLTEEFCEHAASGATVIRGNCYEGDVAASFGPWLEALRSLIEQTPDEALREALGDGAPEIAVMLPELRRRLPAIEEALRLDPESERARLFDSIGAFLRNSAQQKPLVVFLDDLHWCDRPSLLLLEQVARNIVERRIVIIGTYRDVEVDRVHPLAQTLAALRRLEHHERLAIRGFTEEAVFDLLTAIEPSEQTAPARRALAGVLHADAEGNPFFIREVLNNLVETGKLLQQDGAWVGTVTSIEELGIPEGIKEVIGRRLSRLSEGCNRMLGRASALTSGFTWEELAAISDEPEDELLDYLDEALGAQLIAEGERGHYQFTHALIRHALYDELSTPRRVRLHRRVAESLEALYADDIDAHLGELAAHYLASAGGDAQKAIEYSSRAGDRALAVLAFEEAARLYGMALHALDLTGEADESTRCELLLALGEAHSRAGDYDSVRETFGRAAHIARSLRAPDKLGRAALGFGGTFVWGGSTGDHDDSEQLNLLEEALVAVGPEDSVLRVKLLARIAGSAAASYSAAVTRERRAELSREAVEAARRLDDSSALAYALDARFWAIYGPDNLEERLAIADELVQSSERAGDKERAHQGHHWRMLALLEKGDIRGADRDIEAQIRLAEELRQPEQLWYTEVVRGMRAMFKGDFASAEQHIQQCLIVGPGVDTESVMWNFTGQMFALRRERGQLMDTDAAVGKQFVLQNPDLPIWRAALALIYRELGQEAEARSEFEHLAANDFDDLPRDPTWMVSMVLLSEVCSFLNDTRRAVILHGLISPFATRNFLAPPLVCNGSASRYLGLLAATIGEYKVASRHFEDALEMNERMGARPWVAWTQHDYARMLLARGEPGDREKAQALLTQALEAAQGMGMRKLVEECERLVATV